MQTCQVMHAGRAGRGREEADWNLPLWGAPSDTISPDNMSDAPPYVGPPTLLDDLRPLEEDPSRFEEYPRYAAEAMARPWEMHLSPSAMGSEPDWDPGFGRSERRLPQRPHHRTVELHRGFKHGGRTPDGTQHGSRHVW